jgi:putative FmdB family regulatory protein
MLRVFDFCCTDCGETTEEFIQNDKKKIDCPICGGVAKRQLAMPRLDWKKMGLDPDFATAYDKWGKAKRAHSSDGGRKGLSEGGDKLLMY